MRLHFSAFAVLALSAVGGRCWPDTPFVTCGRWIHNSKGENVTYAGVNWPGAADVMIPEGLQYTSIAKIVSDIKTLGMNAIRLTFAIEMIDDIFEGGNDVTLAVAFNKALGTTNGTRVYQKVLQNNPTFSANTTRLDVFDAVAAECHKQQVYIHLDNHMSSGRWCCSEEDGNAWFGDVHFNVTKWNRGLHYMVKHARKWPALTGIGLRNELRNPKHNGTRAAPYNWAVWYTHMTEAAKVVNEANPDILVAFSGLNFDTQLRPVIEGANLGNGTRFRKSDFAFQDKIIMELHNYERSVSSCDKLQNTMMNNGFNTLTGTQANTLPMLLTEWGHHQEDASYKGVYATCLRNFLPAQQIGWFTWAIGGSYYIRLGIQDSDELWGLYNHDWSAWRRPINIVELTKSVKATLA